MCLKSQCKHMYPSCFHLPLSNLMEFVLSCMTIYGSRITLALRHTLSQTVSPRAKGDKFAMSLEPRACLYTSVDTACCTGTTAADVYGEVCTRGGAGRSVQE